MHRGVQDHDPHPALFDGLLLGLRELGTAESDRWAVLKFLWMVLVETGHQPEASRTLPGVKTWKRQELRVQREGRG